MRALVLFVVLASVLAGCSSRPADEPSALASAVPGPETLIGAPVDAWFFDDGSVRLCGPDLDPGFTVGLPDCDEGLDAVGLTREALLESYAGSGFTPRMEEGIEVIPTLVIGTLAGRTFTVVSTDPTRYLPASQATPTPTPTPGPSFATDEEKLAYARSEPVPQSEGCTPPSSGWASMAGVGLAPADAYQDAHPELVLGNSQTFVDHDGTQIALIAIAKDADAYAVSEDFDRMYPGAFCIRRSDYTLSDLERVEADPVLNDPDTVLRASLWTPFNVAADDPDPIFRAFVTVLTDEIVERAAEYPAGLVRVDPWFEPVVDLATMEK